MHELMADLTIFSAGIPIKQISGQEVSVHVGCFTFDYMLANAKDPENGPRYSATGMAASLLSNRISTFFNLTGPSITIDTACSSSLAALDLACRSIRQGESSMVRVSPPTSYMQIVLPRYYLSSLIQFDSCD